MSKTDALLIAVILIATWVGLGFNYVVLVAGAILFGHEMDRPSR